MSEYSQSYHVTAESVEAGRNLLSPAGGWVFPPGNGWVTVIPRNDKFGSPDPSVVSANNDMLLWYQNAEDHGWMFFVFDGTENVSSYGCSWDDSLEIQDDSLDLEVLLELVTAQLPENPDEVRMALDRLLHPESLEHLRAYSAHTDGNNPGHGFAEIMGLEHFHWLSARYMASGEVSSSDSDGVLEVLEGLP
jgi:hypothetical protein